MSCALRIAIGMLVVGSLTDWDSVSASEGPGPRDTPSPVTDRAVDADHERVPAPVGESASANPSTASAWEGRTPITDSDPVASSGTASGLLDQDSRKLSLQAVLRDAGGQLITDPTIDLDVTIFNSDGQLVEGPISLPGTPLNNGVVSTSIPIASATMDGSARELELTVNGEVMSERIDLTAVPYAFRVDRVASEELDDDVVLGAPTDQGSLTVYNGVFTASPTILLAGVDNEVVTYNDNGSPSTRLGGYIGGVLQLNGMDGNSRVLLDADQDSNGGSYLLMKRGNESNGIVMDAQVDESATLELFNEAGERAVLVDSQGTASDDIGQDAYVAIERSGWGGEVNLRDAGGNHGVKLSGNPFGGGILNLYHPSDHSIGCSLFSGVLGGNLQLYSGDGTGTVYAQAESAIGEGGELSIRDASGARAIDLVGSTVDPEVGPYGPELTLYDLNGHPETSLRAHTGGRLTLRSESSDRVRVDATGITGSGEITALSSLGIPTIRMLGNEPVSQSGGGLALYNGHTTNNRRTLVLDGGFGGSNSGGGMQLFNTQENATVTIDGDDSGAGLVWVENAESSFRVALIGDKGNGGGQVRVRDQDGTTTVILDGAETDGQGGQIELKRADGLSTVFIDGDINDGSEMILKNADGETTIRFDAHHGANGEGRIFTEVLQITGGSDLSEGFDVLAEGRDVVPGMVVAIDPTNPGKLAVANTPNDKCVAGIVSGAGGVRPGMLMGQSGSVADGAHPVALTGRVYCLVDADLGSVSPGDLLTSSPTPGHAMKVTDHEKARGAVIGKAMSGLASGKGLVLVLVSLQ